jgi:hypothetical protein
MKNITHQAVSLPQMQTPTVTGHNTGRILTAMLKDCQAIIQGLVDRAMTDYSDYPAHKSPSSVLEVLGNIRRQEIPQP